MQRYPDILSAVDGSVWFLSEEKGTILAQVFSDIFSGRADIGQFTLGEISSSGVPVTVNDDKVAVVTMHGTMGKHMSNARSGGVSTDALRKTVEGLHQDAVRGKVKAAVLDINSGGGSVHGVDQAAEAVRQLREVIPVYSVANDVMASAAYYVGSAATKVFVQPSSVIGSVGTMAMATSASRALEEKGIDVEIVRSGEKKALQNSAEPLTEKRIQELQQSVEFHQNLFTSALKLNRSQLTDEDMDNITDGHTANGVNAVAENFADDVKSLDEVIAMAGEEAKVSDKLSTVSAAYEDMAGVVADLKETNAGLRAKIEEFETLEAARKERETQAAITARFDAALEEDKVTEEDRDYYVELGQSIGADGLEKLFARLEPRAPKVPLGEDESLSAEARVESDDEPSDLVQAALKQFDRYRD